MNRNYLFLLFLFFLFIHVTGCSTAEELANRTVEEISNTLEPTHPLVASDWDEASLRSTTIALATVEELLTTATFTPIAPQENRAENGSEAAPTPAEPAKPTLVPTITHSPTPDATATPTATPTETPTETATATPLATDTPIPPPPIPIPELNLVPASPQPYLSRFTLLTYYGTPNGPSLGVLGAQPRYFTNNELRNLRAEYQPLADDRFVIPTYHIITSVADNFPGPNEDYNHWLDWGVIQDWIAEAERLGYAVIIDIQPGRNDLMEEFERVWGLLYNPHVHLAIDPEFVMDPDEVPGLHLGQLRAEQINAIQARMNNIGYEIGLNRVLILHQFEDSMLPDKAGIQGYPFVELVIDADGFGGPGVKISDYNQYAVEPGFEYGGFKLFYEYDSPLMSPQDVMRLSPQPAVIIYQ